MLKRMKNLGLILFILLFAACGADGDGDKSKALIGTWDAHTKDGTNISWWNMVRTMDGTNFKETAPAGCTETAGTYTTSGSDVTFKVTSTTGLCSWGVGNSYTYSYSVSGNTATFIGSDTWVYKKV